MQLLNLPKEIILAIADELPRSLDVFYFSLANRTIFHILLPAAYHFNIRHEHSSALHWAIRNGKLALVRSLIEQFHADINIKHRGTWPIFLAISHEKQAIVALLLSQGRVNLHIRTRRHFFTPLLYAAAKGFSSIVEVLVNGNSVEIDASDGNDRCALWYAVFHGMRSAAQLLCQAGANINAPDWTGLSPLKLAIKKRDMAMVKLFLKHIEDTLHTPRHQIGALPQFDQSSLFLASSIGDGSMIQLLVACGVHPNTRNERGESPLHLAATFGHDLAIKILLGEPGIDINARDDMGATALWCASKQNHYQVAKRLLTEHDVEVNVVVESIVIIQRTTSLHHGVQHGNERLIHLLLQQRSINPNITDSGGMTPLAEAAYRGSHTIVRLLLKHKHINVNAPGKGNPTPLCQAATAGHARVVKELLTHPNININEPASYDGSSALLIAAMTGSVEITDLLLKDIRVNPHCADRYGRTALWWAAFKGHTVVARHLVGSFRMSISYSCDPLSVAEEEGHREIAELIRAARCSTTSSINSTAR